MPIPCNDRTALKEKVTSAARGKRMCEMDDELSRVGNSDRICPKIVEYSWDIHGNVQYVFYFVRYLTDFTIGIIHRMEIS